jgi:hypothetical protein
LSPLWRLDYAVARLSTLAGAKNRETGEPLTVTDFMPGWKGEQEITLEEAMKQWK